MAEAYVGVENEGVGFGRRDGCEARFERLGRREQGPKYAGGTGGAVPTS